MAQQSAENSTLFLILGGAALQRCGNHIVINAALAAEGMCLATDPSPHLTAAKH
jgi:hypothetical protein